MHNVTYSGTVLYHGTSVIIKVVRWYYAEHSAVSFYLLGVHGQFCHLAKIDWHWYIMLAV